MIYRTFGDDELRRLLDEEKNQPTDEARFVSLIQKSGGEDRDVALAYAEENKKLVQELFNNQKLTQKIYERAKAILDYFLTEEERVFPIPVRKIAEKLGFEVVERDFQNEDEFILSERQKELGKSAIARMQMREKMIGPNAGSIAGTIFVQKDLDETSKRFGIAHELGHFVLRTVNPIGLLYIEEACPGLYAFVKQREFLANEFAYALLLPYEMVCDEKTKYQSYSINLPIDYSNWIIHLRDLAQMPEYHVVLAYEKIKLLNMYYECENMESSK